VAHSGSGLTAADLLTLEDCAELSQEQDSELAEVPLRLRLYNPTPGRWLDDDGPDRPAA
jgi:hypothetical protein